MSVKTFLSSTNAEELSQSFQELLAKHNIDPAPSKNFYTRCKRKFLKTKHPKLKPLFLALDEKVSSYTTRKRNTEPPLRVCVVGTNVNGLRMSIEASLLGCQVVCLAATDPTKCTAAPDHIRYHLNACSVDELVSLGQSKEAMLGQSFFQAGQSTAHCLLAHWLEEDPSRLRCVEVESWQLKKEHVEDAIKISHVCECWQ